MVTIPCYHPLKLIFTNSYEGNHEEGKKGRLLKRPKVVPYDFPTNDPFYLIPCGKCIGCRLEASRQWANRLMLELKYHDPAECWFVTLTYDDENVPINYYFDSQTGERKPVLSLSKAGIQQFHKNLRKHYPQGIRYYLAGEYGENTFRPHYHGIYFSLPLDPEKLVKWKVTDQGFTIFKCSELEEIWRCGNVMVSSVSWETCAYTARYVTKKLNGQAAEFYTNFNLEPEFALMSRKPGIGCNYFEDHPEILEKGIHLSSAFRSLNCDAPRAFKEKVKREAIGDLTLEEKFAIMSTEHSAKADQHLLNVQRINSAASSDFSSYLRSKEYEVKASTAALKRSDV